MSFQETIYHKLNVFTYVTTYDKVTSLPLKTFTFLIASWTIRSLRTHQILVSCDGDMEQAVNPGNTKSSLFRGKITAVHASVVVGLNLTAH